MISGVDIKNFKSIQDSGRIEIRPITILIGPNSSGKSSLIQLLLLLKQTAESPNIQTPLILNGPYVNLGAYSNIISKHKSQKALEFEFSIDLNELRTAFTRLPHSYSRILRRFRKRPPVISYRSKIKYIKRRMRLQEFSINLHSSEDEYRIAFKYDSKNQKYRVDKATSTIKNPELIKTIEKYSRPYKFYLYSFGLMIFGNGDLENIMLDTTKYLDKMFIQNLHYIGPLREYPRRYYVLSSIVHPSVGPKGENTINVILTHRNPEEILSKINQWLTQFGIAENLRVREIKSHLLAETLVEDPVQGLTINISDVGFGLSQILPVIVEGFYALPGSLILIEQPEIHLHPKLQAEMTDLFIDIVKSGKKKLIVETHSEHIILRLQRRIVEGKISPKDVAIYFFEMQPDGTKIRKVNLDELGRLENWPKGFFDESANEMLELTKARLRKISKQLEVH